MHLLATIIRDRLFLRALAAQHGVKTLLLYGSVLARRETEKSDINFIALFDGKEPSDLTTLFSLMKDLEVHFGRKVKVLISGRGSPNFLPTYLNDPVDIMELDPNTTYTITPKTSDYYYKKLHAEFVKHRETMKNISKNDEILLQYLYSDLALWVGSWLKHLLRIDDNDLRTYEDFDYKEVQWLCKKHSEHYLLWDSYKDFPWLVEQLEKVEEYVNRKVDAAGSAARIGVSGASRASELQK